VIKTIGAASTSARTKSSALPTAAGSVAWLSRGHSCRVVLTGELTWRVNRRRQASFRSAVVEGGRAFCVDLRSVWQADSAFIAVLVVYGRLLPSLWGSMQVSVASPSCRALLHRRQPSHLRRETRSLPARRRAACACFTHSVSTNSGTTAPNMSRHVDSHHKPARHDDRLP
jgi:ABC-type transporter Mla MlaB component